MKNTIVAEFKYLQDNFLFCLVVFAGVVTKVCLAIKKGKKPTWKWFLAEAVISFFVAFSVYAIFDQFLHFNKMFTYMVCAWGGSMSTLLHKEVEELISSFFDSLKNLIKTKLI